MGGESIDSVSGESEWRMRYGFLRSGISLGGGGSALRTPSPLRNNTIHTHLSLQERVLRKVVEAVEARLLDAGALRSALRTTSGIYDSRHRRAGGGRGGVVAPGLCAEQGR